MDIVQINIKERIDSPSALTREQGKIIYDYIVELLDENKSVVLDFSEIESLITPFLNVAIGKLYEKYTSAELQESLKIINIPIGKTSSFKMVIENAKKYYCNQEQFNNIIKDVIDT